MTIKMFAKRNNELVVTGLDRADIFDYMLNTGMFCKLDDDENLYIQCEDMESAKASVVDLIIHNHDIEEVTEEYHMVYTFECFE